MLKQKGSFTVRDGDSDLTELGSRLRSLPAGDYDWFVYNRARNRVLPQLKYLCGVVLKAISDALEDRPPVSALYRYYENLFAPERETTIDGKVYVYRDLKSCKAIEMDVVTDKVIHHAQEKWGIRIPTIEESRQAEAVELYADAYSETWRDFDFNRLHNI